MAERICVSCGGSYFDDKQDCMCPHDDFSEMTEKQKNAQMKAIMERMPYGPQLFTPVGDWSEVYPMGGATHQAMIKAHAPLNDTETVARMRELLRRVRWVLSFQGSDRVEKEQALLEDIWNELMRRG